MTNPMIEAAARAITVADGENPDSVHWPSDSLVWEAAIPAAQAAITAIEPMIRAQVEREIVEWLRLRATKLNTSKWPDDLIAADELDELVTLIEAGEHRRHNPNCAVVRNGNLRAWCDCGKGLNQ